MRDKQSATRGPVLLLAADGRERARLRVAGATAIGAGGAGLLGLVSVIPWPELFSLGANPGNAVVRAPGLMVVLIGHYAILVTGAACGLVTAVLLARALRASRAAWTGAVLLAGACLTLGYASAARAVDLAAHDGRASIDLTSLVWAGGGVLLVAVAILTLGLRRESGTAVLLLGLSAPVLVAAGIALFALGGLEAYPEIWGVTFPPPMDYVLAAWFVSLGLRLRRAALGPDTGQTPHAA